MSADNQIEIEIEKPADIRLPSFRELLSTYAGDLEEIRFAGRR